MQNHLLFFAITNFVNHVLRQAKQSSRNIGRWMSFVKSVLTFEEEQFTIIFMIAKQFTIDHHKF